MTTEEKIEELRRRIESACKTFENPGDDYEKGRREVYHTLRYYMNNELFPPPRKGCWGFFADRSNLTGARVLCVFDTQDEAIKMRTTSGYAPFNPGPVIFIEEPCAK